MESWEKCPKTVAFRCAESQNADVGLADKKKTGNEEAAETPGLVMEVCFLHCLGLSFLERASLADR